MRIRDLFEEAKKNGALIVMEDESLEVDYYDMEFLSQVERLKHDFFTYFRFEKAMKENGWVVGYPLETYLYQLSENHIITILWDENKFIGVRATYFSDWSKPIREKVMGEFKGLEKAVVCATGYINWYKSKKTKLGGS